MDLYRRNGGKTPLILILESRFGDWSATRFSHIIPGETPPVIPRVGGCVGPRYGLVDVEKRKIFPWKDSNPGG
jgi:hypothetical protein